MNHFWVLICGLLAVIFWNLQQIQNPYVIDEAAFPYAAQGVATNGAPFFYNGETRPTDLGIWHPPLYVYLLGTWLKIFGFGHIQVRTFGLTCLTITCILIYKTIKIFASKSNTAASIGTLFYGTHYFVIQSSLIPDIDGTLLPLVISLFFFGLAKLFKSTDQIEFRNIIFLTITLGLNFSTKLTTPLLLSLPLFIILYLKTYKFIKSIFFTALQIVCALVMFLTWWIPVSKIQNLDWTFPFRFTFQSAISKGSDTSISNKILDSLQMPQSAISWLGYSTFVLIPILVYLAFKNQEQKNKIFSLSLLTFSCASWMVYNSITDAPFTFPKYWNVGLLGISLCIGILTSEDSIKVSDIKTDKRVLAISVYCLVVFAFISWSSNYRLNISHSYNSLNPSLKVLAVLLIFFTLIIAILAKTSKIKFYQLAYFLLLLSIISINSGVNTVLAKSEFSTRYYFGEFGQKQVLTWLMENSNQDSVLFAAKDIGLESGLPFYEDALILASVSTSDFAVFLESKKVNLIVIRNLFDYSPQIYANQLEAAVQGFHRVLNSDFGDFQVWERIND